MANYIDKNILCQAYVHIDAEHFSEVDVEKLKDELLNFARSRGRFFFYPEIEIEIEDKPGSLKLYVTVLGTLGVLYQGIAQYGDFREGAILLYEDSKRLSEYLVSETLFTSKSRHDQIVRVEARVGVIGSIKKIITELNAVESGNGELSAKDLTKKLQSVQEDVEKLLENINLESDKQLVVDGLRDVVDGLSENPRSPSSPAKRRDHTAEYVTLYRRELEELKRLIA